MAYLLRKIAEVDPEADETQNSPELSLKYV